MRPKDAATLIVLRDNKEVLLGVRSSKHVFMPHKYVFPGGRVDAGDARVPSPIGLRPEVNSTLLQNCSPARARALAMTAVRETWEETGLMLGAAVRTPLRSRSPGWRGFYEQGLVPDLARLDYVARAVTPPGGVRRFNARFFLVDARYMSGELAGNGELEDLSWVPLKSAHRLALAPVTEEILKMLRLAVEAGGSPLLNPIPVVLERRGKLYIDYEERT